MNSKYSIGKALTAVFLVLHVVFVHASKIDKGFGALYKNDYFKAKEIFTSINKKKPDPYSSYGLATIFSRRDNPFFNADSAARYASQAYHLFLALPRPMKVKAITLNATILLNLADSIAEHHLQKLKQENSVIRYDKFLAANYLASQQIINEAVYLRDELEFNTVISYNKSDSTRQFYLLHPQSNFFIEAFLLCERQTYDEFTFDKSAASYKGFLQKFPASSLRNNAYEKLFEIYRSKSDVDGLRHFVNTYPVAPQSIEAWKLLFSLLVKSYTNTELKRFLEEFPAFPLKNSILKELELNNIAMFPYHKKDLTGFVNAEGKLVIEPMYEAVTDFYEGLSVVSKNDSVYFINKENTNVFTKTFSEAYTFKDGIAPVKKGEKWFFINRSGQAVSRLYDEINELSNSVYVVKINNKYGAVDRFGQMIIEPKFDKLGDFKNDYAYYLENNKYGFVTRTGAVHRAEYDWISDFNTLHVAIFKLDNKFGLVNGAGKVILEAQYEQILKTTSDIFVVVNNSRYGFFSSEGCFVSPVEYEYARDKPANFYTNGDYYKLIKKGEQSLMDKNGRTLISFESYNEIDFYNDGLMRVRKDSKKEIRYGYLDKKLSLAIPLKYDRAGDFADSVALVKSRDKFIMLSASGVELLVSEFEIQKLSSHYYLMNDGFIQLLNQKGKVVFADIQGVQVVNPWLLIVTLGSGEIKLLYD